MAQQGTSPVSTTLLVLVLLLLLLLKLESSLPQPSPSTETTKFEPLSFLASRLSAVLVAYLSATTYARKHHHQNLLSWMLWTWRRPVTTVACIELFATASASLLMALRTAFAEAAAAKNGTEGLVISGSLVMIAWLGPTVFAHSEVSQRLSVVASIVEEDCAGMRALERAEELVKERKLQGFALTMGLGAAEQAAVKVLGLNNYGGGASVWGLWSLIFAGPVLLMVKFFSYFVYTVFYFECKKGYAMEKRRDGVGSSKYEFVFQIS